MYLTILGLYLMTALIVVNAEDDTCEQQYKDEVDSLVKAVLIDDCKNDYKLLNARMGEARDNMNNAFENFERGFDAYQLQNYDEAFDGFMIAATLGHDAAQYNLAIMNTKGEGTPQNLIIAYMWADTVVSNGVESGRELRDAILERMSSQQISKAQALVRECKNTVFLFAEDLIVNSTIKDSCLNFRNSL